MAGAITVNRVARWDGMAWHPMGTGFNGTVWALARLSTGDIIAGGAFTAAGATPTRYLARWDGSAWTEFQGGASSTVYALGTLPAGELLVGGAFVTVGSVVAERVAMWDGAAWRNIGTGVGGAVYTVAGSARDRIFVGGDVRSPTGTDVWGIAGWNGSSWTRLGGGANAPVNSIALLPDGRLVAGGNFQSIGAVTGSPGVAIWDGADWAGLGGVRGFVNAVAVGPDGQPVIGGYFDAAHGGGAVLNRVARWADQRWVALGSGVSDYVGVVATLRDGSILVGGNFTAASGAAVSRVGRFASSCPAGVATHGASCASSGGANTLTATTLPYVASTLRLQANGLPATAVVLVIAGLTSLAPGSQPLASLVPSLGQVGCDLLAMPDIVQIISAAGGAVRAALPLPDNPSLVGLRLFHQMLPIELDGLGRLRAMTATNALQLTLGSF